MDKLTKLLNGNLRDYRPVPFWSWNDDLDPEELRRQIRQMKKNGMGGFFMHARGGLKTEYLGEKWFDCIRACIDESKKQDMNAWSYDENGWPSGFAGMKLLEDEKNHEHYLERKITDAFDESATAVYFFDGKTLKRVKAPCGDGKYVNVYLRTNPSVVDILDRKIVRKFIDLTHERYLKECGEDFGTFMKGFFTDEPQYYRWATPYSDVLIDYFKQKYGIDVWDHLGKLFIECEGDYSFRYKYWNALHHFFIDSFIKQIYDWCNDHGCMITGHAVEESVLYTQMWCCGGLMDFYEYEHIPGVDWLGRVVRTEIEPKQVGSAAEQLGKKHVLTETFACCGWDVTPRELKRIAEFQYVGGVNLMCQHLAAYSIHGQRKRDYPLTYSEHMAWFEKFGAFNEYFSRLGYILAESKNRINTLIIHPIKSGYLDYKRDEDNTSMMEIDEGFREFVEIYGANNIPHHYGDENIMKRHAKVEGNKLVIGEYSYEYVVLPKIKDLDKTTLDLLKQYLENGGKLLISYYKPKYLEGEPYAFDELYSNVTLDEIKSACEYEVVTDSKFIRSAYRTGDFGTFLYVVNIGEDAADVKIKLNSRYPYIYDIEKEEKKPLDVKDGYAFVHLDFAGSAVIFENDEYFGEEKAICGGEADISGKWKVVSATPNSLTVDKAKLSLDGENWTKKAYVPALYNDLIKKQYIGKIYLKYEFTIKQIPQNIFLECEEMSILSCKINGNELQLNNDGTLDKSFLTANIGKYVKEGVNEIVYCIDFYQRDHVFFVLNDVTSAKESFKNCLSYDTELESIYIRGDFGVYADDLIDHETTYVSDGEYYISGKSEEVDASDFVKSGYLFFAGNLQIEKKLLISPEKCVLSLNGRFAVTDVYVDGKLISSLMFTDKADLSEFADGKEHTVRLSVYSGNRNLYGPHHYVEEEPLYVSPYTFDLTGAWKDDLTCDAYRERYAFVKFSIKK